MPAQRRTPSATTRRATGPDPEGIVRDADTRLVDSATGQRLDPRLHQGWWVLVDTASRDSALSRPIAADPAAFCEAVSHDQGAFADGRLRLTGFYLAWQVFRLEGMRAEQYALLAAADTEIIGVGHPLADYGGADLVAAFRSLLTAADADGLPDAGVLIHAYEAADRYASRYPQLIGFARLRRRVGIAVIEHLADAETRIPGLLARVRADFHADRDADPRWTTPQLRAEALAVEAQLLCLNAVSDYSGAARLIVEARSTDRRAVGESEAALRARLVAYDQQLAWIRSLAELAKLRQRITADAEAQAEEADARMRQMLEDNRRDSLQQVGLLAAVVALLTSVTGARSGGNLGDTAMGVLLSGGVILITFSLFSLTFTTRSSRVRWAVAGTGVLLLVSTLVLFLAAPLHARFG